MSYTDPCRGDCGANHWPDCSPECSSMQPAVYTEEQKERWKKEDEERKRLKEEVCEKEGHDWEYTFIISQCKRCGETTDY